MPVLSVILIDELEKIVFAYSNPDYKVRMNGDELMKAPQKAFQSE
ncbi:MAG TPA: hypothetical protein PLA92_03250 [Fimbriimonadaceae bacterium]|nr:hypothetical protein [Fimbriimonadaceae bacterium]